MLIRRYSTRKPPPIVLRPYQEEAIQSCTTALESGFSRIAVSLPTGSGKTVTFLSLLNRLPPRSSTGGTCGLVIVNNIELVRQTEAQARRLFPHWKVSVDQGIKKPCPDSDLIVATWQTLVKPERLAKYDPHKIKAIVVDEAHHSASDSYLKILAAFHPELRIPDVSNFLCTSLDGVPLVGFSATWARLDGVGLGVVYQKMVYHKDLVDLIDEGWLCDMRFSIAKRTVDLNTVKIGQSGDFESKSLARVMKSPEMNELVVKTYLERAAGRKSTLVFCVNVAHSVSLMKMFRAAGVNAECVHAGMPMKKRQQILEAFKNGDLRVLLNVLLLTEGVDFPNIDCIMLVRPTRSHALFRQMIGRGFRHAPGKTDCYLIDFLDSADHARGIVSVPSLLGLNLSEVVGERSLRALLRQIKGREPREYDVTYRISQQYTDYNSTQEFIASLPEVHQYSHLAWIDCGDDFYVLNCMSNGYLHIQRAHTDSGVRYQVWKTYKEQTYLFSQKTLLEAVQRSDAFVQLTMFGKMKPLLKVAPWRHRPARSPLRDHVVELLKAAKGSRINDEYEDPVPATMSQGHASDIVVKYQLAPLLRLWNERILTK